MGARFVHTVMDVEPGRFHANDVEKLARFVAAYLGVCASERRFFLLHATHEADAAVPDPLHLVVIERPLPEVQYLWGALARATRCMVVCYRPVTIDQAKALRAVAALEGAEASRKLLASWQQDQLIVLAPRKSGLFGA